MMQRQLDFFPDFCRPKGDLEKIIDAPGYSASERYPNRSSNDDVPYEDSEPRVEDEAGKRRDLRPMNRRLNSCIHYSE